jgi:hypothetical protein
VAKKTTESGTRSLKRGRKVITSLSYEYEVITPICVFCAKVKQDFLDTYLGTTPLNTNKYGKKREGKENGTQDGKTKNASFFMIYLPHLESKRGGFFSQSSNLTSKERTYFSCLQISSNLCTGLDLIISMQYVL